MKKTEETAHGESILEDLKTDLERQHEYAQNLRRRGEMAFSLIAADTFVEGMRDSGYKSTAHAIDEFIDNGVQAGATRIDVVYTTESNQEISNIAVMDNGHGMEPDMARAAILWGGTHRPNNRQGFGRFGFGLPSAAVSITKNFEVYSLLKNGNWHRVKVDLDDIAKGKLTNSSGQVIAPEAKPAELPKFVIDAFADKALEHGTVIVLKSPDRLTSGFRKVTQFHKKLMEQIGLNYRGTLKYCPIFVNGNKVLPVDPLFLDPNALYYDVGNGILAEGPEPLTIEVKTASGDVGYVRVRFSYMHPKFQVGPVKANNERFGIMKANNAYFIVTRAGRQIDLVARTNYTKESHNITLVNYDRNWAIELDFDPILDEEFGITVNKQQITISDRMWQILESNGIPLIVKGFKDKLKKARAEAETVDEGKEKTSEAIMREADKFKRKIAKPSEEKRKQSLVRVEKKADDVLAERKLDGRDGRKDEVIRDLFNALKERPYKLESEPLEGAPFYRVEPWGPQLKLFLNTRHRFYTDLYKGPDSTPRLRAALELLLFVLGSCEVEADGDRELFYKTERAEWSKELEIRLALLDRGDSVVEAQEANEEALLNVG